MRLLPRLSSVDNKPRRCNVLLHWYEVTTVDESTSFSMLDLPRAVSGFVFSSSAVVDAASLMLRVSMADTQPWFELPSIGEPPPFRYSGIDEATMAADTLASS